MSPTTNLDPQSASSSRSDATAAPNLVSSVGNCRVAAYCLTRDVNNCVAAAPSRCSAFSHRQTSATTAEQCGSTMRTSTSSKAVAAAHVAALDAVTRRVPRLASTENRASAYWSIRPRTLSLSGAGHTSSSPV